MKKIIFYSLALLVLLILISLINFNYSNTKVRKDKNENTRINNGITFLITPYNDEYLSKELTWLNVKVINNSNTNFRMIGEFILGGGLSLSINDDKGNNLNSILRSDSYAEYKPDTVILSPGQVAENDINLGWYMSSNKSHKKIIVDASYNDLKSNQLEIQIKDPGGFEKEMFDLWNEYEFALRQNKIDDELRFKVIELNNKYPQSRYIPQLYDDLLRNLKLYKSELYLQEFHKYLEVNANHPTTNFLFPSYKSYLKNVEHLTNEQIVIKLNELIQDYPNNENFKKYVQRNIKLNFNKDKAWFVNED